MSPLCTYLSLMAASVLAATASVANGSSNALAANTGPRYPESVFLRRLLPDSSASAEERSFALQQFRAQASLRHAELSSDKAAIDEVVNSLHPLRTAYEQSLQSLAAEVRGVGIGLNGTILMQHNVNGTGNWRRSWSEYRAGFSDEIGNFWLGNEMLYQLTSAGRCRLRVEVQAASSGRWFWAEYSSFAVGNEASNYRLQITGFSGNTGKDALAYHNSAMFSTYERDNDEWSDNCASSTSEGGGGGFWYKTCRHYMPNSPASNFKWYQLNNESSLVALKSSRMWLLCA